MSAVACRRCSECIGAEHHWIDNYDAESFGDATHECKHCESKGDECHACGGTGDINGDSDDGYVTWLCQMCSGHGVIKRVASPVEQGAGDTRGEP